MALTARVFGRTAPSAVAKDVMAAPSLHQTPAPAQPADVVEHPNLANYYNALDACYEILKSENDPARRMTVTEFQVFCDGVIEHMVGQTDLTTQAPAPSPSPMAPPMGGAPPVTGPTGPPPAGASGVPGLGPVPSVPAATTPPAA